MMMIKSGHLEAETQKICLNCLNRKLIQLASFYLLFVAELPLLMN